MKTNKMYCQEILDRMIGIILSCMGDMESVMKNTELLEIQVKHHKFCVYFQGRNWNDLYTGV